MGVEALRNKTEQNRLMANDAQALANNATSLTSSLEQVSIGIVIVLLFWKNCSLNILHSKMIFSHLLKSIQDFVVFQSLNDTEKRYQELQMKIDSLGGDSGGLNNINEKAMAIKKEAEDLLNKATKGMEQLKSE